MPSGRHSFVLFGLRGQTILYDVLPEWGPQFSIRKQIPDKTILSSAGPAPNKTMLSSWEQALHKTYMSSLESVEPRQSKPGDPSVRNVSFPEAIFAQAIVYAATRFLCERRKPCPSS